MKKIHYPSLNGLRALSIIPVIMQHLFNNYNVLDPISDIQWLRPVTQFLQDGHLGVNVFFVISGFLITLLMLQEEQDTQSISLKNFYLRRTLRIFPAYFFLLLVYFIMQSFNYIDIPSNAWLSAITYTKYFNWNIDWYTAHTWSLSVEEHFYLLWPLVFISGEKTRKIVAIGLIILVPCIRTYTHFYPISWINPLSIFTRIDAIATGCFFALYKDEILSFCRPYWKIILYLSLGLLFWLRYFLKIAAIVHMDFIFIPLGTTYGTIANLLIAIIMIYSVFGQPTLWSKFLNLKLLNYVGMLSYSIYLWQQFFTRGPMDEVTSLPVNLLFIFIMSLFSYYLVEKPFLRLKNKFSARTV